jgi:hypothetical protein
MSSCRPNICGISSGRALKWHYFPPLNAVVILVIITLIQINQTNSSPEVFTNSFLVRFTRDADKETAHQIAKRNGFINLGAVSHS